MWITIHVKLVWQETCVCVSSLLTWFSYITIIYYVCKAAIYMKYSNCNRQAGNLREARVGAYASRNKSEAGLHSERLA